MVAHCRANVKRQKDHEDASYGEIPFQVFKGDVVSPSLGLSSHPLADRAEQPSLEIEEELADDLDMFGDLNGSPCNGAMELEDSDSEDGD